MTDQQRLRDALSQAVPEPPDAPGWGASARSRARDVRRRRITVVGGVVVVVALAVAVAGAGLWGSHRKEAGPAVTGSGHAACRQLVQQLHAVRLEDSRVVDGATAARWLGQIGTHVDPEKYRDQQRVTVCLTWHRSTYATYAVSRNGRYDRVTLGEYTGAGGAEETMAALDRLRAGGRATTDAPFQCPGPETHPAQDVSVSLPPGSTGALLCYSGPALFSPPVVLSSAGAAALVDAINASSIDYVVPNMACGGIPDFREYSLVFRYPSGTRTVTQEECRGLAVGAFTRGAPLDLDLHFERLLLAQTGPPASEPPGCPDDRAGPGGAGDLRHIVAARYCPSGTTDGRTLATGQLSRLQKWGGSLEPATTEIEGFCVRPPTGWPHLALADAWGNVFTMTVQCQHRLYPVVRSADGSGRLTYPLGDQRIVEHLFRELAAG